MKIMVSQFDIGADLSLYKQSQLWRMNNSLNVAGGYYKTQINIEDIIAGINLEEIKYLAEKPHLESFEMIEPPYVKERDWLIDLWQQTECPDNSKLKLPGGVPEGYRNGNIHDTGLGLKTQQYCEENAIEIGRSQNQLNDPPLNDKEVVTAIKSAYKGDFYKKFSTDPALQHLKDFTYWHKLTEKQKVAYILMLTDANVRENIYKGERIRRNQFVYGKFKTPKRWGFKQDTLRSIMDKFANDGIVSRRVISRGKKNIFTIVTLLSFDVSTHQDTHTFNEEQK